jgi:hypothetical protein
MTTQANPGSSPAFTAYLVVGIVAAVVSAATAVLIFRSRSRELTPQVESVQELLDRSRNQLRDIEEHMAELHQPVYMPN